MIDYSAQFERLIDAVEAHGAATHNATENISVAVDRLVEALVPLATIYDATESTADAIKTLSGSTIVTRLAGLESALYRLAELASAALGGIR